MRPARADDGEHVRVAAAGSREALPVRAPVARAPGSWRRAASAWSWRPRRRRSRRSRRPRSRRGTGRACATSAARTGARRSASPPCAWMSATVSAALRPGADELGRPQAEDVPLRALDLLADDDLDAVVRRVLGGLERALVGVVVADRDDREVGSGRDELEDLPRRGGAVRGGRMNVHVCGRVSGTHGVLILARRGRARQRPRQPALHFSQRHDSPASEETVRAH